MSEIICPLNRRLIKSEASARHIRYCYSELAFRPCGVDSTVIILFLILLRIHIWKDQTTSQQAISLISNWFQDGIPYYLNMVSESIETK